MRSNYDICIDAMDKANYKASFRVVDANEADSTDDFSAKFVINELDVSELASVDRNNINIEIPIDYVNNLGIKTKYELDIISNNDIQTIHGNIYKENKD